MVRSFDESVCFFVSRGFLLDILCVVSDLVFIGEMCSWFVLFK